MGAVIIAAMLMGAGYGIGNHSFEALRELANGGAHTAIPTRLTAIAATVSIVAKEALYRASIHCDCYNCNKKQTTMLEG